MKNHGKGKVALLHYYYHELASFKGGGVKLSVSLTRFLATTATIYYVESFT